jgi:cell division protein FtsQ
VGYYRGSKVSLKGGEVRHSYSIPARKPRNSEGQGFFSGWGSRAKDRMQSSPETRSYAFYRPGMTPVEGTPEFSRKKKAWVWKGPSLSAAKWVFRLAALALLIGAVAWSKQRTTALLQDLAGMRLEKVTVEGNRYLSEDEVLKAVALPAGENMFKLDLTEALERVKKLDWVDRVFIERRLPRSILISVRERKPVALLDSGVLYGVDREGRVMSSSPVLLKEDLPLISGTALQADAVGTTLMAEALKPALDFFAFLKQKDPVMAQNVSEVNLSEPDALKVTFIDGIEATFNPPVSETELRRMALVMSDLNQKGKRAGTMDFRYHDMVLVKTRE